MTKGYQLYDLTPSVAALLFRNSVAFRARVLLDHILGQFDPGILVNSNCQQMMVDISGSSYSLKKCYQYVMQFGFDTSQYCSFWFEAFEAPSPAFKQVRLSLLCPSLLPEIQEPERSLSYPVLAFRVRTHTIHLWYLYQHSAIQHQNGPTDPKWCPTAGCFAVHMADLEMQICIACIGRQTRSTKHPVVENIQNAFGGIVVAGWKHVHDAKLFHPLKLHEVGPDAMPLAAWSPGLGWPSSIK